ncbi:hypothetical protein [Hymenobacter sp. B81]|uniref:hypothetical protein n=1 Tax=Hymenobacter sp. B81 TaxID=3344878 RepID=UPI0037DCD415
MTILLLLILVAILCLAYTVLRANGISRKQRQDFLNVFSNKPIALPALRFGAAYGWPTFEVTFTTNEDFEFAQRNKLLHAFEARIQAYQNHYQSDVSAFRASWAISYKVKS